MSKILVVDDDTNVLKTMELLLKRHGLEVVLAPGGEDCLQALRQGFQGIILMDIMMPGLSGWQTIQAMVTEHLFQGVLVCMLTARPSPGTDGNGLEEYVFDYLPKPFDNATLLRLINNARSFLEA